MVGEEPQARRGIARGGPVRRGARGDRCSQGRRPLGRRLCPRLDRDRPADLKAALDANPKARAFFDTLTGANRYAILYRVETAKKPRRVPHGSRSSSRCAPRERRSTDRPNTATRSQPFRATTRACRGASGEVRRVVPGPCLIPILTVLSACSVTPKPVALIAPPPAVMAPLVAMPAGRTRARRSGRCWPTAAIRRPIAISRPLRRHGICGPRSTSPRWRAGGRWATRLPALQCGNPRARSGARPCRSAIRQRVSRCRGQLARALRRRDDRLYNILRARPRAGRFLRGGRLHARRNGRYHAHALPGFAQAHMAAIDRPFTDFYRAYDAWRNECRTATLAMAAATSPGPRAPYLKVDPAVSPPALRTKS